MLAGTAFLVVFASGFSQQFASWRVPSDYAYLNDYKLVPGWNWSRELPDDPVMIAYATSSQWGYHRVVATTAGIGLCMEETFHRMAMEQGIAINE
jgi:hypothetical protein